MNAKKSGGILNSFLKPKQGQGLSVNAIILIVLGVIVLVLLILGFALGWDKVLPFLATNNVNNIVNSCGSACSTNAIYDFCTMKRQLKAESTLNDVTCYYLSQKQPIYGVQACPSVTCDSILSDQASATNAQKDCQQGKIVQYLDAGKTLRSLTCA